MGNAAESKKITRTLFLYWLILLLWQNFGNYDATSSLAVILKVVLIAWLFRAFFTPNIPLNDSVKLLFWIAFFILSLLELFLVETVRTSVTVTYYLFPAAFAYLTLIGKNQAVVTEKDYFWVLKAVIATDLFACLYAVIVQRNSFLMLLSRTSAYGYELTSFFISNHEFGMYLAFGILGLVVLFQKESRPRVRAFLLLLTAFLTLNLIATFSRTAMVSAAVMVFVFIFLAQKPKIRKWIVLAGVAVAAAFLLTPKLSGFFQQVVLKGMTDADRFKMWENVLTVYRRSSLSQKLFGHGYTETYDYFKTTFGHGSAHNAYLQILLVWGWSGLAFFALIYIGAIRSALRLLRIDRNYTVLFLGLALSSLAFMYTGTACVMQSTIDSYLLTVFAIVLPRYVANGLVAGERADSNRNNAPSS